MLRFEWQIDGVELGDSKIVLCSRCRLLAITEISYVTVLS